MMTSSNGNNLRVTGPLRGELIGHRWIPRTQRSVTWSFDVFFDLRLNKWLSKQSWGWWYETPLPVLWRHCNEAQYWLLHIFYRVFMTSRVSRLKKHRVTQYYRDVTWAPWRLEAPSTRLLVRQIFQIGNKENIKVPHYWPTWQISRNELYLGTCYVCRQQDWWWRWDIQTTSWMTVYWRNIIQG